MITAIQDRAYGAFIGLAVGDAIGTTLEFERRDTNPPLNDMVGGGPFGLQAGQWTDDASMALCLADSLIAYNGLNERDLMERFVRWYEHGEKSCTGRCFDIGITTRDALERFKQTGEPKAGPTDPRTAGNGSIMRLAPVALRYWNDPERLRDVCRRQSYTTHGVQESVDACEALGAILATLIAGRPLTDALNRNYGTFSDGVQRVVDGSWKGKPRSDIRSSGYVIHTLEAAMWCLSETTTFREAVLLAVNLGDDADTVGAVTGQIAGATYGLSAIPEKWVSRLAWSERLTEVGMQLIGPPSGQRL